MDKMSKILIFMKDYKTRTLNEIEEIIGSRCSSSVTHLYQKGMLYATDIKYYMKALTYKGGGRRKRPHGRQRWYRCRRICYDTSVTCYIYGYIDIH